MNALQEWIEAEAAFSRAAETSRRALAKVIKAADAGELQYEQHYAIGGLIVYVAHPESTGPRVSIIASNVIEIPL